MIGLDPVSVLAVLIYTTLAFYRRLLSRGLVENSIMVNSASTGNAGAQMLGSIPIFSARPRLNI